MLWLPLLLEESTRKSVEAGWFPRAILDIGIATKITMLLRTIKSLYQAENYWSLLNYLLWKVRNEKAFGTEKNTRHNC
jgi:hypothetical protein